MAYELKERERKVVWWGAILVLPALFYLYGLKPLRAKFADQQEQLVFERDALVRERAAIAAAKRNPQLQHVADSLMQTTNQRLFSGQDDVMASAELGSYLGEVASKHHFLLTTATTGAVPKTKSIVRTLSEDIRGESDLQGVLEFLQALEQGPKLVRVTRIDISRPTRDADDIETVLVAATVTAFALPPEPIAPVNPRRGKDSTSNATADSIGAKAKTSARVGAP